MTKSQIIETVKNEGKNTRGNRFTLQHGNINYVYNGTKAQAVEHFYNLIGTKKVPTRTSNFKYKKKNVKNKSKRSKSIQSRS
jgi:hypothetical protein